MLAYAASRPVTAVRKPSPNAMLAIIAAHVAVVAAVMSAKMDLPPKIIDRPTEVTWIPTPKVPPANPKTAQPTPGRTETWVDHPTTVVPTQPSATDFDTSGMNISPTIGPLVGPPPTVIPTPLPPKTGPQLLTPPSELRPPYPQSKIASGEEAVLKLQLSIDDHGRVVAVEPIGRADAAFLDAARRHLIAHWRYKPASEGGRALGSTVVIILRFQLDG
jgi:protein TonB